MISLSDIFMAKEDKAMPKGYVSIPDGQVSYRTEGSGQPVLLLHQTPWSFEEYSLMIPILAKSYHVIAMETLGYGYSDNPSREYSVEEYAESIVRFLDALKIKKVSIIGHHTGAVLGVELAATHPDRVDKLVASGLAYKGPEDWRTLMAELETHLLQPAEDGLFLTNLWKRIVIAGGDNKTPKSLIKPFLFNVQSYINAYDMHKIVARYDIRPRLSLVKCPTLAVSGSKDLFMNELEIIRKAMPRCRSKVIDGTGVFICLEKPKEFSEASSEFFKNPGV